MSNRLLIKKSSVAAKVPVAGDLEYGELAINYTDEKIYFKNASNVIKSFNALSGAGTVTSVAGAGTVSGLTLTGTVTSSGSLTLGGTLAVLPSNFASQTANTVLAAPDGAAGTPTFRNLTLNDLPDAWVKKSVGAATTAALTINTAQVTIDGVTLAASTRVLIKNQAAAGENGIYTGVTTTTWVRTPDADTASEIAGAFVNVDAGTVNGGRVFDNDFKSTDTLGTTAMNWSQNVDVGYFTTVGNSFATLADPTAITFPRINADNTVSALAAAAFRTAIGAGTSSTTGTVTSVAALTLGTTGTDITSTVATGTTTAVITLNVPTASAANRGALSAADWTTFNNKVGSLTDTLATVTARGATTSTAITLSGTLSFAQPVGLSFANGQYIKDNSSGGLVIYSGANINLTGTTVVTGTASVSGTLSTTGLLTGAFNSAAVIPPSLAGFTLGWNYTNGGGEVDFWNTYTPGADSFHWYQRTATPTATKLMALNTTGLTITGLVLATTGLYAGAATSGVTRGVVTSEGNFLSFYAAETTARVQLGRDVGISGGAGLALGGSTYALIAASDTAGTALHFKLSAAASTATTSPNMSLTATGLGLGTTVAPGANGKGISIYTSDYPRLSFRNSTTGDATTDGTQLLMSGLDFYLQNQEAGALIFNTSSAERMRITSGGRVGIGTTSPSVKLEVAGATGTDGTSTASIAGTTMDVTVVASGTFVVGDLIYGANIQPYTRITAFGTGTGGTGTYTVSVSQTAASAQVTRNDAYGDNVIRITNTDLTEATGQPTGVLQFYTSDSSAPTAGVGAYVGAMAESATPDTALVFGTRDNAGGGIDANERMRITSAGGLSFGSTGTAYGTSGQVLQSNGNASPTWVAHVTSIAATTPIVTSAATGAITLSHAASGATAGTYNNVTVNATGHVTAGSNTAYLTAEADTLATVTARGATTALKVSIGSGIAQGAPSATDVTANATLLLSGNGGNYLAFGQHTTGQAQWIQSAYSNPTTAVYPIALQPLGGNVGIGTYAPAQKLHVVSSTNYQGILVSGSAAPTIGFVQNAGTVQTWKAGISGLDGTAFSIGQGTGGTDSIIITTGNNVGIGITAPGARLDVRTSLSATAGVQNIADFYATTSAATDSTYGGRITLWTKNPNNNYWPAAIAAINDAGGSNLTSLGFYTATSGPTLNERMRLDSSGNLGIGTTAPASRLSNQSTNIGDAGGLTSGTGAIQWQNSVQGYVATFYNSGAGNQYANGILVKTTGTSNDTDAIVNFESGGVNRFKVTGAGNVGIGTTAPAYKLHVVGSFAATTKSFVIDHPTKPGMQLRHGSLEGPENGVYVRGRLKGNKIELPEYWTKLVDPDSITVNLTAIGKSQDIYVEDIKDNVVYVGGENVNCFYTVYAERVDVAKLEVEIG